MGVRKAVTTWSFCATFKARALVETQEILSEYWNNRNLLMSKNEPFFQKSKRTDFSSLTIFYCFNIHTFIPKRLSILWVLKRLDLTIVNFMGVNFMGVKKAVTTWSFCATFKARALVETQEILSEYWNNRNLLMSKNEPFFQKSRRTVFSSLTIFYCFNIHTFIPKRLWGFDGQFYGC